MQAEKMELTHAQPIQTIRVNLDDIHAMKQLSQKRSLEEYTPSYMNNQRFLLPPNVERFVYSPEAMGDLQEQAQKYLIEDAHIRIIRHRLLCSTAGGIKMCFAPLHVTRSFCYHGIRISGSYFVSLLHSATAVLPESYWSLPWAADVQELRSPLSPQERQALIEYYMSAYLKGAFSCTDLTIIAIPSKAADLREKSPTHRAFSSLAIPCSHNDECVIPMGGTDTYVFAHNKKVSAVEYARELLSDAAFMEQLTAFGWSSRIAEKQQAISKVEAQDPECISLHVQQLCTLLERVRGTWKNAEASQVL